MLQRRRARAGLLTAALLAVAPATASAECQNADVRAGASTQDQARGAVRCLINEQRRKHGLGRLTTHRLLRAPANRLAGEMVRKRFFGHVSPDGTTMMDRLRDSGYARGGAKRLAAGETIGYGSKGEATPRVIVRRWMNSPGHRAVLLDRRFKQLGVGVAEGSPFGHGRARTFVVDVGVRTLRSAR